MTNLIELDFETKRIKVTGNDVIGNFKQYTTKRQIRNSQVKKLINSLKSGKGFRAIAVNKKNGKLYILDGNHRYEALVLYLQENPDVEVEVELNIYNIEDSEEEREEFLLLNDIVKPSSDDYLQQYAEDSKWFKKFLRDVNYVSIYGNSVNRPMKAKVVLSAYAMAIDPTWRPRIINAESIVNYMMNSFNNNDIKNIQDFLDFYVNVYGVFQKNHSNIRTTPFTILFRIWYQNKDKFSNSVMSNKFAKIMIHPQYKESCQAGGNWAVSDYAPKFCSILNKGLSRKRFELE